MSLKTGGKDIWRQVIITWILHNDNVFSLWRRPCGRLPDDYCVPIGGDCIGCPVYALLSLTSDHSQSLTSRLPISGYQLTGLLNCYHLSGGGSGADLSNLIGRRRPRLQRPLIGRIGRVCYPGLSNRLLKNIIHHSFRVTTRFR